jgi:hypothetical protein
MPKRTTLTDVDLLSVLVENDPVQVCDEQGNRLDGKVDVSAPDLGVVWIFTDKGERKAVDVYDFAIEMRR